MSGAPSGGSDAPNGSSTPRPRQQHSSRKREPRPQIDLDMNVRQAQLRMEAARKAGAQARAEARGDSRKKARLIKKAGGLSAEDLERIAVLKRCALSVTRASCSTGGQDVATGCGSASSAACAHPRREVDEVAPTAEELAEPHVGDAARAPASKERDASPREPCAPAGRD